MQRFTAVAVVFGALIVAVSLMFHGRQLASVAKQMEALEHRTGGLDNRLEKFSQELPSLVEQAGKGAGQQAVHGIIEEAFQKPLRNVASKLTYATSNVQKHADSHPDVKGLVPGGGIPLVRFDIPSPVVNIEIVSNIKDLPSLPWRSRANNTQVVATTHHNEHTQHTSVATEVGK